ncbi:MAG: hypothetical protein JRI34_11255 [Deltaproteobacteria bacterium]|nr:hypothetical protein [Deltaproteobacteria bacterium]
MDREPHDRLLKIINILEENALNIRTLEAEAREALYIHDDTDTYRTKLEQKAVLILELADEMDGWLDGLDADLKRKIQSQFAYFAHEAGQALDFSSPFYMSTLLHVMDTKADDTNDLEKFIKELKQSC